MLAHTVYLSNYNIQCKFIGHRTHVMSTIRDNLLLDALFDDLPEPPPLIPGIGYSLLWKPYLHREDRHTIGVVFAPKDTSLDCQWSFCDDYSRFESLYGPSALFQFELARDYIHSWLRSQQLTREDIDGFRKMISPNAEIVRLGFCQERTLHGAVEMLLEDQTAQPSSLASGAKE